MILNRNLEMPRIIHFPGMSQNREFIDNIIKYTSDINFINISQDQLKYNIVTCFTPNLNREELLLVNQLESLGISYINAWDFTDDIVGEWKHINKLIAYKNYLDIKGGDKKYTLFLDAKDVLLLSLDILTPSKYYRSAKMLFNGDKSDFPNMYGKNTIKSNYPVYLNAGVCLCENEYALGIFNRAIDLSLQTEYDILRVDDQALLRELWKQEENHIKVDEECKMGQNINGLNELIVVGNNLIIK